MKIGTARFGTIEIDPGKIITVPDGVIGFPDFKRYVVLEFIEGTPFELFQAVDNPGLAFVLIDPRLVFPDYTVEVGPEDLKMLQIQSAKDLTVMAVVTLPEKVYEMTANLKGPIAINLEKRLARQIVNPDPKFRTRHKILSSSEAKLVRAS